MNDFYQEIKDYSNDDLQLILTDQRNLYTEKELSIIQQELNSRGGARSDFSILDTVQSSLKQQFDDDLKNQEERARQKRQAEIELEMKKRQERIDRLKQKGYDGYYEYLTLSLVDNKDGGIDVEEISNSLNDLALEGWHLKCAFSNELGRNSRSNGVGGIASGTNSTIDQNILILERFNKIS